MISDRLQKMLADTERISLYDAPGRIITPAGAEAAIEARAIRCCLRIALEEESVHELDGREDRRDGSNA